MLSLGYDPAAGLISSISRGVHSTEDVSRYLEALDCAITESRSQFGEVKHFIDATDAGVQPDEVIAMFMRRDPDIIGPTDRMALVVASSLAKAQAAQNFRSDQEKAFISPSAAMTWLMASRAAQASSHPA